MSCKQPFFLQFGLEITAKKLSEKPLILPENTSPLAVFSKLANQAWAMWLDSCESEHIDSRFDIIVWQPDFTITTQGISTRIQEVKSGHAIQSEQEPLSLLESLQTEVIAPNKPSVNNLPFSGGALGYFAYDLGQRFEKLPNIAENDINLPEMAVGIYSQAIVFDKQTKCFYLLCPEESRKQIEANIKALITSVETQVEPQVEAPFKLTGDWQANMDKASYTEKFNKVQDYLLSGDCYQINLAQRFNAPYRGDEFHAYLALRKANQAPFSAFIRLENAAILSVSPERFLKLEQGSVQTKPIKGTMPRSADLEQDKANAKALANSTKDRAENLMIVDLLRNDISKSCQAGTVKVPKLFDIESFPAVHHLVSTIEGELQSNKQATDLLRGAFPGGSITGAPKIRAMEIIEELEPHKRSVYCGSIGYISACGTMDTSITIRTLICQQNESEKQIYCWAGGGLVADSTAKSEYQETFDKVNKILPVLNQLN